MRRAPKRALRVARLPILVLLAGLLAGCEGEDGPLYTEEDWPDFNFGVDAAALDAEVGDVGRPEDPRPDATRPPDAAVRDGAVPDGAVRDGAVPDAGLAVDAHLPDASPSDAAVPMPMLRGSAGCNQIEPHPRGGEWIRAMDFGPAAGGVRGFYLTVPPGYDPAVPSRLIVGFSGTNWLGGRLREYLRIEEDVPQEIFVYPDPLWRDFGRAETTGGWQLGPLGFTDAGDEDLEYTSALLDYMQENYCIDLDRVFVTGHSWGGDMAAAVSCLIGDRVRASAPTAARSPFYLRGEGGVFNCAGQTAVWTFFGIADDHFNLPDPGSFGDRTRDFWLEANNCIGVEAAERLDYGPEEQCFAYQGCDVPTRYCLYGPATGHQIPPYFSDAIMEFFRSF